MIRTKNHFSALAICLLVLLNSCGVFTPMRYSKGFKSNLEFNFSKKEKKADRIVAAKAVKKSHPQKTEDRATNIAEGQSNVVETETLENNSAEKTNSSNNNKHSWKVQTTPINFEDHNVNDSIPTKAEKLPYEPHVKWAAILFFGGLILSSLLPFVGIATIIGFFLALKGRRLIDESEGEFRGRGMANTIIIIVAISAILTIITVALVVAILFA
jgi:hypothetical protein